MKYKINLITKRKDRSLDRVIYFVMNYLRYILVITQIVVIGVFFYRFKIDQEMVDLQEAVQQKKEIIQVSQPLIKEAKRASFKLDQIRSVVNLQENFLNSIDYLLSTFPESLFLTKVKVVKEVITLVGYTQDGQSIQNFLARLRKDQLFKKVDLKNIKKGDQGLEFTMEFSGFKQSKN